MKENVNATKAFAEKIKELRSERKLTSNELAKFLEVSGSIVLKWEKAQRSATIDNLSKVADFFGVSTDYLLGRED